MNPQLVVPVISNTLVPLVREQNATTFEQIYDESPKVKGLMACEITRVSLPILNILRGSREQVKQALERINILYSPQSSVSTHELTLSGNVALGDVAYPNYLCASCENPIETSQRNSIT